jgi:dihydroorotate dehydrogenase electron transfer subunit
VSGAGPAADTERNNGAPPRRARVQAPFGRRLCAVSLAQDVGAYRLIGVEDGAGPSPAPGQFYMLATERGWGSASSSQRPFLSRAFSVCRVRGRRLDFLLEAIGPGTERLAELRPGEQVWVVGPLGIGFSAPPAGALLVGGGIGIAPLVIWSEELARGGIAARALLGFRSADHAAGAELMPGDIRLATDDGESPPATPATHHGFVTDLLQEELDDGGGAHVYACGPPPMLEAVRRICVERGVPAQLAMEAGMACGFGACFGCVVRTRDGYRRLCVDGPVVAAADLEEEWE